jgi:hypothetical protein
MSSLFSCFRSNNAEAERHIELQHRPRVEYREPIIYPRATPERAQQIIQENRANKARREAQQKGKKEVKLDVVINHEQEYDFGLRTTLNPFDSKNPFNPINAFDLKNPANVFNAAINPNIMLLNPYHQQQQNNDDQQNNQPTE